MTLKNNIYFKAYNLFARCDVGFHYQKFMENQWLTGSEINQLQIKKLNELLKYANGHVPYYRHIFKQRGLDPEKCKDLSFLRNLPLLRKEDIQRESKDLISEYADKKQLILCHTGGSTGKNITFYFDRQKRATMVAARLRSNSWIGEEMPFEPTAYLWAVDHKQQIMKRAWAWVTMRASQSIMLDLWEMNRGNVKDYVSTINTFKPKILIGYGTALYMLTMLMEEKQLKISAPLKVISTAELLTDKMAQVIREKISPFLYDRYGCREVGLIAMTCDHQGYHLNADNLIVEIVDENGNPVAQGEEGQVVITDLNNLSMPFIRYVIEDRAIMDKNLCTCGRGLSCLKKMTGRMGEILLDVNNDYIQSSRLVLTMEEIPGLERYQIYQKRDKSFCFKIKLIPGKEWQSSIEDSIRERVYRVMKGKIPVSFCIVDEIPLSKSGKFKYIISEFHLLN